jgi:hypothetical protein
VVHGTNKSSPAAALAALAAVLALLSTARPSLILVITVLLAPILAAEVASASPRLAIMARLLRLVHSFIHSSKPVSFLVYLPDVQEVTWAKRS